jgi:uncharacterized protein (TIGR03435 family)
LTFRWTAIAAVAVAACTQAAPQPSTPARRQFEVASIKRNISGPPKVYVNPFVFSPDGRFVATNVTLTDVIQLAYRTVRVQMRGGPDWIDSDRFNFAAKADESGGEVKPEQWPQMVQALLEARFKLELHREMEEKTVYALVPGKTPQKLLPAKNGEPTAMVPGDRGAMNFQKMPISGLVNTLANILHTPVIDGTGLTGDFDFTLDPLEFSDHNQPVTPDSWPGLIVTALREELGFKLEKRKASLEITVIDRVEQPTGN